jgi:predicted ribosomally synthesized peptide with SipW-like signal peptide
VKHKKLVVTLVVVAMAILASVAYAWWSDTVTSETNTIATGEVALDMGGQLPIEASGLAPQSTPAVDAADDKYACVDYFWVENESSIPLMFYGWLSDGSDPKGIAQYVNARIWLLGARSAPAFWTGYPGYVDTFQAPGPWLSFEGTVAQLWTGRPAGIALLSSRTPSGTHTPINPGEVGVYRVALWLDSSAPDSAQNALLAFKLNFTGVQEEGWGDHIASFLP